jgi:hypothetical protein
MFAANSFQTFSSTGLVRENWSSAARNSCRHDSSVFSRRAKPMMRNRRHLLVLAQMIKRGNQLARGQVAARAEDDDGTGYISRLNWPGTDREAARKRPSTTACHKFLSNPVIEDYKLEIE